MKKIYLILNLAIGLMLAKEYSIDDVVCKNLAKQDNNLGICKDKDGNLINGNVNLYYPSGELLIKIPYKNGRAQGVGKTYKENGELLHETLLKNSKIKDVTP